MKIPIWSLIVLIASLATAMLALALYMLKIGPVAPVLIITIGAMIIFLASNLVYAFTCAASWITWFRRKGATDK